MIKRSPLGDVVDILGKTIVIDQDLGVADGQEVEVQVKVLSPTRTWGEGILRTAGALADDPYWDAIMEEVHRSRNKVSPFQKRT